MPRPDLSLVPAFYHNYINQVPEDNITSAFKNQTPIAIQFYESIPERKHDHRYAEGKWTVREVLQHIIDGERIFSYRALRFARTDATPLAGFDENVYAVNANAGKRDWNELIEEFKAVRKSSEYLFGSFDEEQLNAIGTSGNKTIPVVALGYIIVGHPIHHKKIIEERYL
jgi:uncharacterized damage-inducible protein DinB